MHSPFKVLGLPASFRVFFSQMKGTTNYSALYCTLIPNQTFQYLELNSFPLWNRRGCKLSREQENT